jgi:glycosyltransferase involved in cell wall biosynthesis
MKDLSVIIPARNEMFLARTVEDVLENLRADTEVIAVCDGNWPDPPLQDHPRLVVVHVSEPIGQRAATNLGARISQAKYLMKLDAHCAVDEGFDLKLMEDCHPDWTMVPSMHNLHAFDWKCCKCGYQTYQGARPTSCSKCQHTEHDMVVVWKPRENRLTVSWRFDTTLQFQYWRKHAKRPEAKGPLIETMSFIGACMFLERDRFWALGGMDEQHGSWGQFGTEWACKSWLSGGKLITTRKTWFAHMFRTGNFAVNGQSTWPYPISQGDIERARQYSRDLWLNDRWPLAKRKLNWLVDHFAPVPEWHEGVN